MQKLEAPTEEDKTIFFVFLRKLKHEFLKTLFSTRIFKSYHSWAQLTDNVASANR